MNYPNELVEAVKAVADAINGEGGGGSSDYTIAKLTLHYSGEHAVIVANITDSAELSCSMGTVEDGTFDIILYKGKAVLNWDSFDDLTVNSGDAEVVETGVVLITGDCEITVTGSERT